MEDKINLPTYMKLLVYLTEKSITLQNFSYKLELWLAAQIYFSFVQYKGQAVRHPPWESFSEGWLDNLSLHSSPSVYVFKISDK